MFYKFFNSYKGRSVQPGQRVQVYRNLKFKDKVVYSIRDATSGLVLGHGTDLLLSRCLLIVKDSGRKRVLKEKKKNVHAWIEGSFGIIHCGDNSIFNDGVKVSYNPYKNYTFVFGETDQPLFVANLVYIDEQGVFASGL